MIIAKDLRIEAGIRVLVDEASIALHPGDRVGLVGHNGAGKTTLLRTLAGRVEPASGTIARSGVVGYLSQEAALPELERPDATALDRILSARDVGALRARMEDARAAMDGAADAERDRLIRRFGRLEEELQVRGGWAAEAEARRFAASVGIGDDELSQPVATMSGGQRRRVELARVLYAETDVLLLDEPTNHLDLDAKRWLVDFLAAYKGALLMVSHDLPLLDEAITSVLAVEHGRLEAYRGTYSHYLDEREARRAQRLRERKNQLDAIERLESTALRFKGTTEKMSKRANAMLTRVERMRDELVQVERRRRDVAVRFPAPVAPGRIPLEGRGLAMAYGDNVVFVDVDVHVERGERVAILGLNGAGKTTLLRILAGRQAPDLGVVELGLRADLGFYAQEHEDIDPDATVLEHLRRVSTEPDQTLRSVLGHFLLADKIEQEAGTLSGGEKTKLALARLVMGGHNVLLLDEPTNNLDPQAKSALLAALDRYEGSIVLVSHDTEFVAALAPGRAVLMPEGESAYFDEEMLDLVALA
ncbi:MAG: ABC-F family ATP-binding cassette domain-containing protein [Acidimicrobiia bacterium]|nr:ABC-F family ATP-binding cassette domain-containing protein [Acidimicrobiia bacterium]